MEIPTDGEIRALHREYAPSRDAFELVHEHCRLVCSIAEQFFAGVDIDTDLVRAGALLHDIGVYRLESTAYVRHGVLGHELLASLGFPVELCRFASCHTGVGITRDDVVRQSLPIPVDDYLPRTPEEELVMYADKFHSKRLRRSSSPATPTPPKPADSAQTRCRGSLFSGTGTATRHWPG